MYVKNNFNYEVLDNPTNFKEALKVDIVLSLGNKLSIVLVCRSPSRSDENCNELILQLNRLHGALFLRQFDNFGDKKIDWDSLEFESCKQNSYEEQFVNTVIWTTSYNNMLISQLG